MNSPSQVALDDELGRDNLIDVLVYNPWGHLVDVIPAFLGDRGGELGRDRWSLHAAVLWGHLAVHRAERLPPNMSALSRHDDGCPPCVAAEQPGLNHGDCHVAPCAPTVDRARR